MSLALDPVAYRYHGGKRISAAGVMGIAAAHLAVVAGLAALNVGVQPAPLPTPALMVEVVAPATLPAPEVLPPRPKPVEQPQQRPQQRPLPAAPAPTLATRSNVPGPVAEAPVVREAPPSPAPAAAPAPTPVAAPIVEPRFDAAYLQNPAPVYPAMSRRLGEEGKVVLRVFVEPNGHPSQIELRTGSGSPRLDQAAQEAVWRWKFTPARRGDEAVGAWVLVPLAFNLRG